MFIDYLTQKDIEERMEEIKKLIKKKGLVLFELTDDEVETLCRELGITEDEFYEVVFRDLEKTK